MTKSKHDPFRALSRNAFDFLERSIKEFAGEPKYSVIHFCAAIEMLLKARLMKEHWSLIVSKPEQASMAKFRSGEFVSVTLDECRQRLRDVAGEDIGDDALKTFRALASHRNKMIHFFHADIDGGQEAREQIVSEQCKAWMYLHGLMKKWPQFEEFGEEIRSADRAMKEHRKYLRAKFEALRSELQAEAKAGKRFQKCSACDFKAAEISAFDDQIETRRCRVCDYFETLVRIPCPGCKRQTVLANEGFGNCGHCGFSIDPDDLVHALLEVKRTRRSYKDGDETSQPANCDLCDGHHTVIPRAGKYFCASCFDITDMLEQCQWCHEYGTGDMEHSYSVGCSQCSGRMGNED